MTWRARCPVCAYRMPRSGFFVLRPRRRPCPGCGTVVRPNWRADFIGNLALALPVGMVLIPATALIVGMLTSSMLLAAMSVPVWLIVAIGVGYVAYPWVTPFEVVPKLCLVCGYDIRATPDRCPECGTVPSRPPDRCAVCGCDLPADAAQCPMCRSTRGRLPTDHAHAGR